jgi:integrase
MRGSITKRGKASWRIKFELTPDPATGKRRFHWETVRGLRKVAEARLTELLTSLDTGRYVERSAITVGEWVDDRIAHWETSGEISARSAEGYRRKFINYIKPHLGDTMLQALKPRGLERWHRDLRTSGRTRGSGGVGPLTIRSAHRILGKALAEAVKFDLIPRNVTSPASGGQRTPRVVKREVEIIAEDKIGPMLAKLRTNHETRGERGRPVRVGRTLYPKIVTLLFTGLRRGELLALRWCDLDLPGKRLRVAQAIEQTTKHGLRVKEAKSEAGRREISLPDIVVEALEEHRREQLEVRLRLGLGRMSSDDFVFVALDGGPQRPDNFSGDWHEMRGAVGVPRVGLHALRHTHASMLIAAGLDVVQISKRLGHASPAITLAVYSHFFRKDDTAVSAAINAAVAKLGK